ncbi:MAG: rRNA maturation RNase YbeY [Clostridia bacterium]|nr:rRNA maturation RNase YbeY [Clostridia bacterium]
MVIYANEQERFETEKLSDMIEKCVQESLNVHGITDEAEISVLFTDNAGIQEINASMRNIDKETDVLSFPQYEFETPGVLVKDEGYPYLLLGDIVLSLEKADEQAKEFGHSYEREVGYLTVHSMLHLLGYDHMTDTDKPIMRAKEEEILEKIGLTRD